MIRISRLAVFLALTVGLAACGTEPAEVPSAASGPLDTAGKAQCDVEVADQIIGEIFPNPGLRNQARVKCRNILRQADRDLDDAVAKLFDFLGQTLDFYDQERLHDPLQGTLEEAIVDLFAALSGAIGADLTLTPEGIAGGDVAFGFFDAAGGTLTVPSAHAAITFHPGDLAAGTWVAISRIQDTNGECPFGFPVPYDCYPLFYDYSVIPQGNLVGVPRIGQCVDETGPDPPSQTVLDRLRIASPDADNPGDLVFWPLANAPGTVDCSDLEPPIINAGLGDALWAGLGPMQWLFSPNVAYANPGRLGASVSTFSPFAPTDPESDDTGSIEVTVVDQNENAVSGATVSLSDSSETVVDGGTTDSNGQITFDDLPFDTYDVQAQSGSTFGFETVTIDAQTPDETVTVTLFSVID